jgi:hypothetical protein
MEQSRKYSDDLGLQFELYKKFFISSLYINTRNATPHSMNLRLPIGINAGLDQLQRAYLKKFGKNISKNDLIIVCLALVLNMEQGRSKEFYPKLDRQSMDEFFEEFDWALRFEIDNQLAQQQAKKYVR